MGIAENYRRIRSEVPENVTIVLAAKTRTPGEILDAINAGATDIGENYVQEAERAKEALGDDAKRVKWHLIGPLQKNKINKALKIFDVIQTVDSLETALAIEKRAGQMGRKIPVYIEINIGRESTKAGIDPDYELLENLAREIAKLQNLSLEGLMTMAPYGEFGSSFRKTREFFEKLKNLGISGVRLKHLSMGMSDSYREAVEAGSSMIRLGTVVFGAREY